MARIATSCFLVLLVFGCKAKEEPAVPIEPAAADLEEAAPAEAEALPAPSAESAGQAPPAGEDQPSDLSSTTKAPETVDPPPTTVERNLASELRAAVGSPTDCLQDYRPSAVRRIRINISAVVRPTGMVIEPSASGTGLSANDRRCVEERVGSVILAPLPGNASKTVLTYVEIQYPPDTIKVDEVAQPPPPQERVVPSLPKKEPIAPSGKPIEGPAGDPIEGPDGVPIDGPSGVPIEGPKPVPIESN